MPKKTKRSHFGTVEQLPGRPGYYVRVRYAGKRLRKYGGPTEDEAETKRAHVQLLKNRNIPLHEMLAIVFGEGAGNGITFAKAAKEFLAEAVVRVKPSTYSMFRHRLNAVLREPWSSRSVDDIGPKDLRRWVSRLRNMGVRMGPENRTPKPLKGTSTNRYLGIVRLVFKWCVENEYLDRNPCEKVQKFSEKEGRRDLYLTQRQTLYLLAVARREVEDLLDLLCLATFCGFRRNEIVTLAWRDVLLKKREIRLRGENTKTSEPRTIPLHAAVYDLLRRRYASRTDADGTALVFTQRSGRPLTPIWFRRRWDKLLVAATKLPAEIRNDLHWHDLRHCFASLVSNAGVPLDVLAELLGHSLTTTTLRYRHLYPETKRAAIDAIRVGLGTLRRPGRRTAQPAR